MKHTHSPPDAEVDYFMNELTLLKRKEIKPTTNMYYAQTYAVYLIRYIASLCWKSIT